MRLVVDTVIIVRALISPYSWWGRLLFDYRGAYQLVVSSPILTEYLDVMQRPELRRKYHQVATRDSQAVLDWLASADVVQLDDVPSVCRDPEDDKFLATAVTGAASFIVSEDDDLLTLGEYEGITIVTAADVLLVLDKRNAD